VQVERTDQQRRHHDAGHQRTGDDPASLPGRPQQRQGQQGATGTRVGTHEERHGDERPYPRPGPERAAPGQCQPVAEQRRHQQQQTGEREASLGRARLIPGQIPPGTPQRQQRQGEQQQEGSLPAKSADQQAAKGGAERRAAGRQGAEQSHAPAPSGWRHQLSCHGQGEHQHAGRTGPLQGASGNEPANGRGQGAQQGSQRKDPGPPEQQATPPQTIPEPARHHRQTGDPKQVGHQHPLQAGEGHAEVLPQGRQHQVGHAARQHGHQGGEPEPHEAKTARHRRGNKKWCGHGSLSGK
jgi:hypothetical protein